jgi:hypothetical protein
MTRQFGRVSFFVAVGSWAVMAFALVAGGLDPSPGRARALQGMAAGAPALLGCILGVIAVVRGTGRPSGALGLLLGTVFLLMFTGAGLALWR